MLLNTEEDEDGNVVYTDVTDNMYVYIGGVITSFDKTSTKSGSFMSFVTLEDAYGAVECVFFPKTHEKYKNILKPNNIVKIKGRLQIRDDNKVSIVADSAESITDAPDEEEEKTDATKRQILGIILNDMTKDAKDELIDILSAYEGDVEVYFKIDGKNYKMSQKVRKCRGLINELLSIVSEEDIKFIQV